MTERAEHDDALDRFLHEARPEPPEGLNERILASVASAAAAQLAYWEDVKTSAQTGLIVSAAVLIIAAVFAGMVLLGATPDEAPAPTPVVEPVFPAYDEDEIVIDQLALVAMSPGSVEEQLASELWLAEGE